MKKILLAGLLLLAGCGTYQQSVCVEEKTEWVWVSWAGTKYYAGETIEEARLTAGDNPITTRTVCVKRETRTVSK